MMPKISVIMGIYNCAGTLKESIDSILAQSYDNWELIMCDDASTDDTYELAKSYVHKYPEKIVLVRNEKNLRLAGSLNHCLRYATGKYIARMDGDDISMPERLRKQVEFLENHPEFQVVGTGMLSFDEHGVRGVTLGEPAPQPASLAKRVPFCHATIVMRAEAYKALGGYRVCRETRRMEDLDLWLRFFEAGYAGYNLQEPLYMVREDSQAFRRRKLTYSIDNAVLLFQACRRLRLPLKSYLYVLKPIIAGLAPSFVMQMYHKKRLLSSRSPKPFEG